MNIFIDCALQPLRMIALTPLLTLVSCCFKGAKPLNPFMLFCISTLMLFIFSMPSVANAFVYRLKNARENQPACANQKNAPMVVLGGGIDLYVTSSSSYETLSPDSLLVRMLHSPEFALTIPAIFCLEVAAKSVPWLPI